MIRMNKIFRTLIILISLFFSMHFVLGALTDNLIQYSNFTTLNVSTYGTNILQVNNPTVTNGIIETAFFYNSSLSQYSNTQLSWRYLYPRNFTVSFWLNTTMTTADKTVFGGRGSGGYFAPELIINQGANNGRLAFGGDSDVAGAKAIGWYYTFTNASNGLPHHYVITKTGGKCANYKLYIDGVERTITCSSETFNTDDIADYETSKWNNAIFLMATNNVGTAAQHFNGILDEYAVWNDTLSQTQVTQLYNNGSGLTYNFTIISSTSYNYFVKQIINVTNITTSDLNFTINASINATPIVNLSTNGTSILFYRPVSSLNNGCTIFYQSLCVKNNSEYFNKTMTQINSSYYKTTIYDNELFPSYYPFNYNTIDNTPHQNYSLYNNHNIMWKIFNFSINASYYINLEFNANSSVSSNNLLIYYCNSTYTNGNPSSNTNCQLIDSFASNSSRFHYHNNSKHVVVPVTITTVNKTQYSYIIFVSNDILADAWKMEYITNTTYDNQSFVIGNYNTWNNISNTNNIFDVHLHSFAIGDYFEYYTLYNDNNISGNIISDINRTYYQLIYGGPSAVELLYPSCDLSINYTEEQVATINILWTKSTSQLNYSINYTLGIIDNSLITSYDIITTNETFYNWTNGDFTGVLTEGNWYYYIVAFDGVGSDTSLSQCTFNVCKNNYVQNTAQCIDSLKLIAYSDVNGCNEAINVPSDNNTFVNCTTISEQNFLNKLNNIYNIALLIIVIAVFIFIEITRKK